MTITDKFAIVSRIIFFKIQVGCYEGMRYSKIHWSVIKIINMYILHN